MLFAECDIGGADFILDFFLCALGRTDIGNGPVLGILLFIGIFFSVFVQMKFYTFERAFAFSTFFGAIVAGMMAKLGWINSGFFYLAILLFGLAVLILKSERSSEE